MDRTFMLRALKHWLFGPSLIVYVGCKMTNRDKVEQVERARFVVNLMAQARIQAISPVLEEKVEEQPGKLVNHDEERLRKFWARDKYIIRRVAHAVVLDLAEMKSFGMEREYCLNRGVLWKPTVLIISQGYGISVAKFEDDGIFYSAHSAVAFLAQTYLSRWQRWKWRFKMLKRSLPKWIMDQILTWR